MTSTAVVIGAGITGVASALHLVRAGWDVTLLDPLPPGDPGQASYGNAGILARSAIVPVQTPGLIWRAPRLLLDPGGPLFLRPRHLPRLLPWLAPFLRNGSRERLDRIVPAIFALTHDTVERHRALAEGTPAAAFIETGRYAYLFRDRAAFRRSDFVFGLKSAHGLTWEETEAAAVDPRFGPDYGHAVLFRDHGWIADPGAYVAALAGAFEAAGGRVLRAAARDLRPTPSGVEVATDAGVLTADRAVLAAGVRSRSLAERLGLKVPMESERGYHLTLDGANRRPPHPCMIDDKALVMTPLRGALRFAGLVEFGGLDAPPSRAPFALIRAAIRRVYPGLTWESEREWMGHRPTLADSLPMLGPVPGAPQVVCAFGGQHLGLTIGPRLGGLAADLAAGRRVNLDLASYAPGRF